jgi:hypothetical protein
MAAVPRRSIPLLLAAAVALFASCASLALRGGTEALVELINTGDAETLAARSATPFLLDDELLVRAADVGEFWRLVVAAGLGVEVVAISVERLPKQTPTEYAATMDVRTFLTSALPRRARMVRVTTASGSMLFLLEPAAGEVPWVHGFKGPL